MAADEKAHDSNSTARERPQEPGKPPNQERKRIARVLRQHLFWRRKWLYVLPVFLGIGACLAVSFNDTLALHFCSWESESRSIIETTIADALPDFFDDTSLLDLETDIEVIRTRMLGFSEVRDIILSGKVDFGAQMDPDDSGQIERLYREVRERTRIERLSSAHLAVSHHSSDPVRNAALVNELVKRFVSEDKARTMLNAKVSLEFYQSRYDAQRKRLTHIDVQVREFHQAHPGFRDEIAELYHERQEAIKVETELREQIQEIEASLQELRKERENTDARLIEVIPGKIPIEVRDARGRVEELQEKFRIINEKYTPGHRHWQAAKQDLDRGIGHRKEIDKGEVGEKVVETDNPRIAELDEEIEDAKKMLYKLNVKLLDQTKLVAEKSDLLRRSPELLTEKHRLDEEREAITNLLTQYAAGLQAADKALQRLSCEAYSARYRVREYARASTLTKEDTEGREEDIEDVQLDALHYAIGMGIGVLPVLLGILLAAVCGPKLAIVPETPARRRARRVFLLIAIAAVLFVLGAAVLIWMTVPEVREWAESKLGISSSSLYESDIDDEENVKPSARRRRRLTLEHLVVPSFESDDLRYPQLDANGFPTSMTHYFREFPLDLPSTTKEGEPRRGFRVSRSDQSSGKIDTYRLSNIGTGEQFLFSDVACKRVAGSEWVITDEGHWQIHRALQARMKVPLSKALRSTP